MIDTFRRLARDTMSRMTATRRFFLHRRESTEDEFDRSTTGDAARARRAGHLGRRDVPEAEHTMNGARGTSFPQLTACPIRGVAVQSGVTTARDAREVVMRGALRVVPPLVVRGRVVRERVRD